MEFKNAFNRIRLETEIQNQEQLATFLGIKQASVSGAKKRGQFPRAWAEKVAKHYNLRYEWIMEGAEPKRITSNMDQEEINIIFDQLRYIFTKASPADRIKVKDTVNDIFQKTRESI
jgi:hypothetical protein